MPGTSDVKSAFLQGRKLERTVVVQPPREANLPKGKLWQLEVALYGLNDANLQFYFKCRDELLKLGCVQSTVDPALFAKHNKQDKLIGILCLHVDDFLHGGTNEFKTTVVDKLTEIFLMGKTETGKFKYVGFQIDKINDGIQVNQNEFANGLEVLTIKPERAKEVDDNLTEEEKSMPRKVAGKIGWLGRGSRPDLVFSQIEMSTKFVNGKVRDLNQAAKATRRVKDNESSFLIRNMGPVSGWIIEVFTDASLGNLHDGVNSTSAQIIIIRNSSGDCAPIMWQANKIKRIVDSSLAAEALSLLKGLEEAIYIREMIEELYKLKEKTIPVYGIVDNLGTVDAVHSTAPVEDRRLRRDIAAIKQMLNQKQVKGISWCPGKYQLADCMTKRGAATWELMEVFQTGKRVNRV